MDINLNHLGIDSSGGLITLELLENKILETLSEVENEMKSIAGNFADIVSTFELTFKSILEEKIRTQKDRVTLCYCQRNQEYQVNVSKAQCAHLLLSLFNLNSKPTASNACNRFLKHFSINGHSTFKLLGVMSVGLLGINVFTTLVNTLEDGIRYLLTTFQHASYVMDDDRKQAMIWDVVAQIFIMDAPIALLSSLYFLYGIFDFMQHNAKTNAWLDHLMKVLQENQKKFVDASKQHHDLYDRWIACKLFQCAITLSPEVSEQFIKELQSYPENPDDSVSILIDKNQGDENQDDETMPLLPFHTLSTSSR